MTPTVAVIPSRYEPARLRWLARRIDADLLLVMDNGHEPPLADLPAVSTVVDTRIVDTRGDGIYRQWNRGWQLALDYSDGGPVNVAILNDDIRILPGTLRTLATALRREPRLGCVYPDRHTPLSRGLPGRIRTTSLFSPIDSREMTGFCFMFKGELSLPAFDEGYQWWYGDTVFDEAVKLAGYGVGRVDGLPIEHHSDAEHNGWARRPELRDAVQQDGIRWAQMHARIEGGRWVPAEGVPA